MRAHGLVPDFSAAALAEANAATVANESGSEIRDLRALLWSSIDNDDSLDLDQIEVAEALGGGKSNVCSLIPRGFMTSVNSSRRKRHVHLRLSRHQ